MKRSWKLLVLGVVVSCAPSAQAGPTIFSSGYSLPETITPVPAGFGGYGGGYFVDDLGGTSGNSTTWYVGAGGGAPTAVATSAGLSTGQSFWRGGTFLPAGFGSVGGQYLIATAYGLSTMNAAGQVTPFINTGPGTNTVFTGVTTPMFAPPTFGGHGGTLYVTAQTTNYSGLGAVFSVTPGGVAQPFAYLPGNPYGIAFAPSKFGAVGGDMLVSDSNSGKLYAISPGGAVSLFANLPFYSPGGLRQMAFAGSDMGQYSGDLFVSISASSFGGGKLGSVVALNGAGDIVGTLLLGTEINAFDPRGITFIGNGNFLVSDASDPLYIASKADIVTVPEPATLAGVLVAGGAVFAGGLFRRGAGRRNSGLAAEA